MIALCVYFTTPPFCEARNQGKSVSRPPWLKGDVTDQRRNLFPPNFISETLRTLALLFPKYDKQLRKLYGIQVARHGLDPEMIESGHLIADERQVEGFSYWHDRLVVLKQVYDESRPRTISQWWHDRRNGVQWYTFWVAILVLSLTVFFGLVQSIEGALQVYAAFHPAV